MGVSVVINELPNELPNPVHFSSDRVHQSYDPDATHRFWRALVQIDHIFKLFRTSYLGKVSPVHFFWGSFDLAVTRFSGRKAPLHPGGVPGLPDAIAREAYSHEVSSVGFWPGNEAFPRRRVLLVRVSGAGWLPEPALPAGARYDETLREFVLPYDTVRGFGKPGRPTARLPLDHLRGGGGRGQLGSRGPGMSLGQSSSGAAAVSNPTTRH